MAEWQAELFGAGVSAIQLKEVYETSLIRAPVASAILLRRAINVGVVLGAALCIKYVCALK